MKKYILMSVCVGLLMLCPACYPTRRDYQYIDIPKIAVSTVISADIADIISLSSSQQDSDSNVNLSTEHF